jgi:signal peptidase I
MSEDRRVPADIAAAVKCDLAAEVLRSFGSLRFRATGWSMLPAIWPGDTLVAERVRWDQVQVGEVVLVGRDGRLCAHRVVSRAESFGSTHWTTQGDAMPAPDRPVIETELLGRVSHLLRAGNWIAVPAELSVVAKLMAIIVRRCIPAARALVCLRRMVQASEESVLPCQG